MNAKKMRAQAYAFIGAIKPKLGLPVCVTITKRKGLDYAALYEEREYFHHITINYTDHEQAGAAYLLETVAHEIQHAKQAESKKHKHLRHDVAFFRALDRVLVRFGLPKTPKQEKRRARELGRILGNGG